MRQKLKQEHRGPTDDEVLQALRSVVIEATDARPYIAHRPGDRHQSLCLGLSARSGLLTARTMELEDLFVLLTLWLRDSWKHDCVTFTSIQLNKNNAAACHRDSSNLGPSIARTLGDFQGGELSWLPWDDLFTDIKKVNCETMVKLDTDDFVEFNGNCAHSVAPFVGERWSVIYFTASTVSNADPETLDKLNEWGAFLNHMH